jgi:hypothetical protein
VSPRAAAAAGVTKVPDGRLALQALMAAAFVLPGMVPAMTGVAHAEDEQGFSIQYGHYDEGKRDLNGQSYADLNLKPIHVDSFSANGNFDLADRLTIGINLSQDTWSGATPVVSLPNAAVAMQLISGASSPTALYTDAAHHPLFVDPNSYDDTTGTYTSVTPDARLVHIMASASPETRRQADMAIGYQFDQAEFSVGGGVSSEHDYHSRFVNVGGKIYLDRKLTTINWGLSDTASRIKASLAANAVADAGAYTGRIRDVNGEPTIFGKREDIAANIGVTQILNKGALVQVDLAYTHSRGFLENPYKAVILGFDDPDQFPDPAGLHYVALKGSLEQRPNLRSQISLNVRFAQHVAALDAALHADYRLFHDNWGITSHSFDLAWDQPVGHGWVVTPQARYYTQTAASFYKPYFIFDEAYPAHPGENLDRSKIPIPYFTSDERLSAFGALSGGLSIEKRFASGIDLQLGYEYYAHRGGLKLGGGGEPSYADFSSSLLTASLKLDLAAFRALRAGDAGAAEDGGDGDDSNDSLDTFGEAPAGIAFPTMLRRAGALAVSLAYDGDGSRGPLRHHGRPLAGDNDIIDHGCGAVPCTLKPVGSVEHRLAVELAYAPTDWLTLTLTPQLIDRTLSLRTLEQVFPPDPVGPHPTGPDGSGRHGSGGIGDTSLTAAFRLWDAPGQHLHAALGVSAPTGSVDVRLNTKTDYASYGLQLGSGTWDLMPSLVYEAQGGGWSAGVQLTGVKRMQHANRSGYRLGDAFSASAWGGRDLTSWLALSVRGAYRWDGRVKGVFKDHLEKNVPELETVQSEFDINGDGVVDANDTEEITVYRDEMMPHVIAGPEDLPGNYGGTRVDAGIGLTATAPSGMLKGDRFSIEWIEPVRISSNGYQLKPGRTLSARVSLAF